MILETLRDYCLSKQYVTEDFPFDETTLVFRVGGKIFVITDTEDLPFKYSIKCQPEYAIELREGYENINPAYHMNKKHWISIEPDNRIDLKLQKKLIDNSYNLVFDSLTKSVKQNLKNMEFRRDDD